MTETNRQSALYSAINSLTIDSAEEVIFARAERFVQWLEGSADAPDTEQTTTVRRNAVTEITDLAERNRGAWGALAVDTILGRVGELEGAPFDEAIDAAIGAVPGLGFGRHLTEAVTEGLRALTQPEQPQAAGGATTSPAPAQSDGERIIGLLEAAVRRYGAPAEPLLNRARLVGGALSKEVAIAGLLGGVEYRSYPAQVDTLVAQIRAL